MGRKIERDGKRDREADILQRVMCECEHSTFLETLVSTQLFLKSIFATFRKRLFKDPDKEAAGKNPFDPNSQAYHSVQSKHSKNDVTLSHFFSFRHTKTERERQRGRLSITLTSQQGSNPLERAPTLIELCGSVR